MYLLIIDKYFKFIKQNIVYGVTNWFRNFFSMSNSEARAQRPTDASSCSVARDHADARARSRRRARVAAARAPAQA